MQQKEKDYLHWTDSLFVPVSIVISFVLSLSLPRPLATLLSFVSVSLVLFLFEPRDANPKRFVVAMLFGALVTFALTFFQWPS